MNNQPQQKQDWESPFDKMFLLPGMEDESLGGNYYPVKDFIRHTLKAQQQRVGEMVMKVAEEELEGIEQRRDFMTEHDREMEIIMVKLVATKLLQQLDQ